LKYLPGNEDGLAMRLLWQSFVDDKQNPAYFERLHAHLMTLAQPGTTIEMKGMRPPDRDFGRLTEFRCSIQVVDNALAAEQQGFDGFVVGHFQDPGLYEARSAVRIPVVGTGEATLHFAAQLGRRIALVSIDPVFEVFHLEQAERYGLRERVVAIAGLGAVPEDFNQAFAGDEAAYQRMKGAFETCALPMVQRGADVVVPAGVLPGLLMAREKGLTVGHAPVLDCGAAALKTAEMWTTLYRANGLEASRGPSFARAPERAIRDFRDFVARGLRHD
jgi:Asp/Glu/hydantoin racemase